MRILLSVSLALSLAGGLTAADIPDAFLGAWSNQEVDEIIFVSKDGYSSESCGGMDASGQYRTFRVTVNNANSFCADFRRSPDDPPGKVCWKIQGKTLSAPGGKYNKVGTAAENYNTVISRACKR